VESDPAHGKSEASGKVATPDGQDGGWSGTIAWRAPDSNCEAANRRAAGDGRPATHFRGSHGREADPEGDDEERGRLEDDLLGRANQIHHLGDSQLRVGAALANGYLDVPRIRCGP
jgi:hypothetical protein